MATSPTVLPSAISRSPYCVELRAKGQSQAAECLERDWEDFVTLYDFPEEHWLRLHTSNPIESVFFGVRLRTNTARRMRVRENALYLVFELVMRLSTNWRAINGRNQLSLLLAGEHFADGRLQRQPTQEGAAA